MSSTSGKRPGQYTANLGVFHKAGDFSVSDSVGLTVVTPASQLQPLRALFDCLSIKSIVLLFSLVMAERKVRLWHAHYHVSRP